jgi:hypothetical protein
MTEHAVRPVRLLQLGDRIFAQGYPDRRDRLIQVISTSLGPPPARRSGIRRR